MAEEAMWFILLVTVFVFNFDIINTTFHLQRRFSSNLGMTNQAVKAAQEAVQKSEELDIRRSPKSVAAVIIYMITQLSDDKKLLKDISVATGVAEGTIRN